MRIFVSTGGQDFIDSWKGQRNIQVDGVLYRLTYQPAAMEPGPGPTERPEFPVAVPDGVGAGLLSASLQQSVSEEGRPDQKTHPWTAVQAAPAVVEGPELRSAPEPDVGPTAGSRAPSGPPDDKEEDPQHQHENTSPASPGSSRTAHEDGASSFTGRDQFTQTDQVSAEVSILFQRERELHEARTEVSLLRQHVDGLRLESEEQRRRLVRQEGYLDALREQLREAKMHADHLAECWRTSERRRLVLSESLVGRALLDSFVEELRREHPNGEELTRRHLLQHCDCAHCAAVFHELHSFISSQVFQTFGVKELRVSLWACYDRFCKVAHPPGMSLHTFETLHDPNLEYTLRALSLRQTEKAGQSRVTRSKLIA